ncbi:MAG TPA: preprotein translocase subunit SecE [Terracidiphilus sp.]|nr:preprotein translocase subunit SecE [Terracidiphilus sp.]
MNEDRPGALANFGGGINGTWGKITHFLSDVRAEMKKVVVPNRKEVETTTAVVLITTFLFGLFFYVVDFIFSNAVTRILHQLGGGQ